MATNTGNVAEVVRDIQPLELGGMRLKRTIAHQVFKPNDAGERVAPLLSNRLTPMSRDVENLLEERISVSLGRRSKSLPIEFVRTEENSFFHAATAAAVERDEAKFIELSHKLAELLGDSQTGRHIPGGVIIVVQARDGLNRRLLLVFKCEKLDGLSGVQHEEDTIIEIAKDLLLTPGSTLYKVCALVQLSSGTEPENFQGYLFDGGLVKAQSLKPVQYFAQGFLGAQIAQSGRAETYKLYMAAIQMANEVDMTTAERLALKVNLESYLRVPEDAEEAGPDGRFISAEELVERYVDAKYKDDFEAGLRSLGVAEGPIVLDPIDLKNQISKTTMEFGPGLRLTGPADVINGSVRVQEDDEGIVVRIAAPVNAIR